ncbi:hypothetical protein [Variovorax ginsengisoli]|uniref:Uncharacterized protein n=1 Tax=Variovorax ginsengisoli TaxID=363844 RepID=A0ABT9S4G4_9BURK|nr:hypothetical protein [Variovorax ginsengisoli]MDP9898773.1 hypothetical protein [Variovorax ginsengisoli]
MSDLLHAKGGVASLSASHLMPQHLPPKTSISGQHWQSTPGTPLMLFRLMRWGKLAALRLWMPMDLLIAPSPGLRQGHLAPAMGAEGERPGNGLATALEIDDPLDRVLGDAVHRVLLTDRSRHLCRRE